MWKDICLILLKNCSPFFKSFKWCITERKAFLYSCYTISIALYNVFHKSRTRVLCVELSYSPILNFNRGSCKILLVKQTKSTQSVN